jgi:hypothetical protein
MWHIKFLALLKFDAESDQFLMNGIFISYKAFGKDNDNTAYNKRHGKNK